MVAPLAEFAKNYYPGKDIVSDGDPIVENTGDAGGTIRTLVDAAITSADNFYDGAIIYFSGATPTVALQGHFAHVKEWLNSTKTFTFAKDLPAIPAAGELFNIIFGGFKRSSQEIFQLLAGGVQPELIGVVGSNITGLTITKLAGKLGEGTLTVDWDDTADEITIKMDSEPFGAAFTVVGDSTDTYIYADDGQSFMKCDIVNASLPASDQVDTHTLTRPDQTLTPDYEGYETLSDNNGKTRYRLEVFRNEDSVNAMTTADVFTGKPSGADTTIATGESIGTAAGTVEVDDATGWPLKAFWIFLDDTVNQACRYVKRRSGNILTIAEVDWADIPFDAGQNEPAQNAILTDNVTGATAIIDQVFVTSGSFAGNDAAGIFLVKKVVGSFNNNDDLLVGATVTADVDGTTVLQLRDLPASSFTAGDAVILMGDIDIGLDAPAADTYENPATETIHPTGVVFSLADVIGDALNIGALAINGQHGVFRREWIMNEAESRVDINADTNYVWS